MGRARGAISRRLGERSVSLHMGHVSLVLSHVARQSRWNPWLQLSTTSSRFFASPFGLLARHSRHTGHVLFFTPLLLFPSSACGLPHGTCLLSRVVGAAWAGSAPDRSRLAKEASEGREGKEERELEEDEPPPPLTDSVASGFDWRELFCSSPEPREKGRAADTSTAMPLSWRFHVERPVGCGGGGTGVAKRSIMGSCVVSVVFGGWGGKLSSSFFL